MVIVLTAIAAGSFFAVHGALAQTSFSIESVGSRVGLGNADLVKTVINIIKWALGFVTLAAVGYMIYGGYLWLTSAGDEKRIEKAKQTILQAAIGLVIILLAWAIVLFISRTVAGVTGNTNNTNGNINCNPLIEDCTGGGANTFDLTAVTTCSARPNYSQNVPLASAVALTFNTALNTNTVQAAITDNTPAPNLVIEKCTDPTCKNFVSPQPKPINNQVYSGASPTATAGSTKAEWVAKANTITFYHLSFSTDTNNPDNRYFEPNTTYRVIIPKSGSSTAIKDIRDRALEFCRRQVGLPIEGDDPFNPNCTVDDTTNTIYWTFTTGTDANGPAIVVNATVPNSQYLANAAKSPDRNVNLRSVLAIDFSNAIDPNSLGASNFQVFKFSAPPNPTNGQGGTVSATPLPASDFSYLPNMTGTGGYLQPNKNLEAFTWYQVVVKDVHNLCGTVQQQNPYRWVFETNDTAPGVKQVYPQNNFAFACPDTEVFVQFKTSMWQVGSGSFDCQTGQAGSYVTGGGMTPAAGRALRVVDQYNPADPNHSCTKYAFTPTSVGLQPGTKYSVGVNTNLTIDVAGTKLNYGDIPPAKSPSQGPWSFSVTTADKCVQPPYIDHVSPPQGIDGQCISVIGNYFEKKIGSAARETDGQNAGDKLELDTVNQDPNDSWTNNAIVSTVKAGSLAVDQNHNVKVTVNYPAPIGPVSSLVEPWRLNNANGNTSQGPCLLSLSQTSGPAGTTLSASGKRFGTYGPQSKVPYTGYPNPSWLFDPTSWAADGTKIGSITVSAGSTVGSGDVTVVDNAGNESNGLPFTVTPPPPTSVSGPKVEETSACNASTGAIPSPNPKKNETQACINAWPSARFVGDMDVSTMTTGAGGNIILEQCDAAYTTCTAVPTTITAAIRAFQLKTSANLAPSTNYRVTIGTSVKNAAGVPFPSPYTWKFTTKAGTAPCPIANVVIDQTNQTFNTNFNLSLPSRVIDTSCNTVSGSGLTYAWTNTDPLVCGLLPNFTGPNNLCTGPVDANHLGTANISTATEGKTSNTVKATFDPTFCTTNSDCTRNGQCTGSSCTNNHCTPLVKSIDPTSGKIGTWVTVHGCWFGAYQSGSSKLLFSNNKEGLAPNSLICGSPAATWNNDWIIREVPNATTPNDATDDAISGPIQVVRADGQTATGPDFTVNQIDHPKLCKVTPTQGVPAAAVNVGGKDFGLTQDTPGQDKVSFTNIAANTSTDATTYSTWKDDAISTAVPGLAAFGPSTIHVFNNNVASNDLPFTVVDPNATGGGPGTCPTTPVDLRCVFGDDTTCPAGMGCGFQNCCSQKPKIIATKPAQSAQNICRNTQAQITFDLPLFSPSVTNGTVTYLNGGTTVNGRVSVQNTASNGTIIYEPGLLSANTDQQLTLQQPIRSSAGVVADLAGSPLKFKTGADICTLSRVVVTPPSYTFFQANQTYFPYQAEAWPSSGTTPLAQVSGVYTWNWNWIIGDSTIASVTNNAPNTSTSQQTVQAKNKAGVTYAQATAQVTFNQLKANDATKKSGQGSVVVDLCENPWTFSDSAGNCTAGGACTDFHFNLAYCRGNGSANLLPDFTYHAIEGTTAPDPAPLKSFFLKENATTRDVIGILVFSNPDFLSPYDWYHQRFPLDTGGSSSTVAGYPALKTGTTTYVGVTNCAGTPNCGGPLQGVMVVLDYNSNSAQGSTKNIYNQLLSKLTFNTNMNGDDAQRIVRDTKRKQDIANISLLAQGYQQTNGSYPNLAAGSYIVGISTSVWPSWQNTLGNTVGQALPLDPVNDLSPKFCSNATSQQCTADADCGSGAKCLPACQISNPGHCSNNASKTCLIDKDCGSGNRCNQQYESSTCWSETIKKFICPANSHVYLYQSDGAGYSIYGQMEYAGPGNFATGTYNPCSSPSTCSCFNYWLSTNASSTIKPPAKPLR